MSQLSPILRLRLKDRVRPGEGGVRPGDGGVRKPTVRRGRPEMATSESRSAQGYRLDPIAGRSVVDSRPFQIFEGSNDILYQQISESVLKLMRKVRETNLLRFLGDFELTFWASDYLKEFLDIKLDPGMPQRKLVELGRALGRILTMKRVLELEDLGFRKELIENCVTTLQGEITGLLSTYRTRGRALAVEDYEGESSWLGFVAAGSWRGAGPPPATAPALSTTSPSQSNGQVHQGPMCHQSVTSTGPTPNEDRGGAGPLMGHGAGEVAKESQGQGRQHGRGAPGQGHPQEGGAHGAHLRRVQGPCHVQGLLEECGRAEGDPRGFSPDLIKVVVRDRFRLSGIGSAVISGDPRARMGVWFVRRIDSPDSPSKWYSFDGKRPGS